MTYYIYVYIMRKLVQSCPASGSLFISDPSTEGIYKTCLSECQILYKHQQNLTLAQFPTPGFD